MAQVECGIDNEDDEEVLIRLRALEVSREQAVLQYPRHHHIKLAQELFLKSQTGHRMEQ